MMVVLVSLESERADKLGKFKRAMTEAPEVMQCMSVTGEVDFVLTLTMRDVLEYESFAQKHFWGDPNVKRFYVGGDEPRQARPGGADGYLRRRAPDWRRAMAEAGVSDCTCLSDSPR